ncbi:MAG: hypothetical protein U9Q30_01535 [Campylobacterota bacterium]|nr:hypothetical protein [Campylobacterota bacterium]
MQNMFRNIIISLGVIFFIIGCSQPSLQKEILYVSNDKEVTQNNLVVWDIKSYSKFNKNEYFQILLNYTKVHNYKKYKYIKRGSWRHMTGPSIGETDSRNECRSLGYYDFKVIRLERYTRYICGLIDKTIDIRSYNFIPEKQKLSIYINNIISQKYNLVKGKFEKTSTFQKRVKYVNDNINNITINAMNKAYPTVYGKPKIDTINYDADSEIFYGLLTSSYNNYKKKIAIKVPLDKAEDFYNNINNITPKVIFNFKHDKLILEDIIVPYQNKEYIAMLRTDDYKPSEIKIALKAQAIKYSKSKIKKLEIDDLPKVLANSKRVRKNKKAYAIIFGIEDYLLESDVTII